MELGVRQRVAATLGISAVAGRAPGAPLPPMACNGERFSPAGRRHHAPYSDGAALQVPCKSGEGMSGRRAALGLLLHGRTFQPCPHGPARASLGSAGLPRRAHFYVCLTRLGACARLAAA